jgi:hypothetical protein
MYGYQCMRTFCVLSKLQTWSLVDLQVVLVGVLLNLKLGWSAEC